MARPAGKARRPRLSLRGFARQVGVSLAAVQKAIASGRLHSSVGEENGTRFIADPVLAAKQWAAGASKPKQPAITSAEPDPSEDSEDPAPSEDVSLVAAQIRVALQREEQLKLKNREERGQLVRASVVKREQFDCARGVRDALLNLPDRLAGELAADSDAASVHARLAAEIRTALESIADLLDE